MNILIKIVLVLLLFLTSPHNIFAKSSYVLPYPSIMPGSFLYKPHLLLEELMKYWYFGNFGQFKYNLSQADRYLVQAKTLFEYDQFLLATESLNKSDKYFVKTLPFLESAKKESENTSFNRKILSEAAAKHIEILEKLSSELPDQLVWNPEKSQSTTLYIKNLINKSISIRGKFL